MSAPGDRALRLGTRRSMLAMAQSRQVADAITSACGRGVELVPIITGGDRYFGPLNTVGGKGLFTAELEQALREGRIDLAVHSAKDMPAAMGEQFAVAAAPARADARDVLVSEKPLEDLRPGAVVGTSSPRRAAQLLAIRPDLQITPLRGNIETRIQKIIRDKSADATVLAMAGLDRSGLAGQYSPYLRPLPVEKFVPAAGQGCLAIQTLAANRQLIELLAAIDDASSHQALSAERRVVAEMGADCHSSLAVHVFVRAGAWRGLFAASRQDGSGLCSGSADGASSARVVDELLELMHRQNVAALLRT